MSLTADSGLSSAVESAVTATQAGGAILLERFGSVLDIRYKGEIDVVTEVDVMAEARIVGAIREASPTTRSLRKRDRPVDQSRPSLDHRSARRTTNYSHGLPPFSVSVAYERAGVIQVGVIYDPTQMSSLSRHVEAVQR